MDPKRRRRAADADAGARSAVTKQWTGFAELPEQFECRTRVTVRETLVHWHLGRYEETMSKSWLELGSYMMSHQGIGIIGIKRRGLHSTNDQRWGSFWRIVEKM